MSPISNIHVLVFSLAANNPCGTSNCQNGGTCFQNEFGTTICLCPESYQGDYCETMISKLIIINQRSLVQIPLQLIFFMVLNPKSNRYGIYFVPSGTYFICAHSQFPLVFIIIFIITCIAHITVRSLCALRRQKFVEQGRKELN